VETLDMIGAGGFEHEFDFSLADSGAAESPALADL